jgi:hypothetical protein
MVLKITLPQLKTLLVPLILLLFLVPDTTKAQTRVYANSATFSPNFTSIIPPLNVPTVVNPGNAYDPAGTNDNLTTFANIKASPGLAVGLGSYSGYVELQFPTTLPANTTSYVKIGNVNNDLFSALLGGSLGDLLGGVLGAVVFGSQEFSVQAKNGASVVLTGDSAVDDSFATARMRIVRNAAGDYFVMLTPDLAYNRIRITNRAGAVLGLGSEVELYVYGAFYVSAPANCGQPVFTSYSGSGATLTVALLQAGDGVANPQRAIDADQTNFSTLSMGALGVAGTIEQTVYFEGPSLASDSFTVRLRLAQNLLDLNVANSIRVRSYNGATLVSDTPLSTLLTLNLLTPVGGQIMSVPVVPGSPIDKITLSFSSLVSLSVLQNLEFFGITRTAAIPTITDPGTVNAQICLGSQASLLATTPAGNELRWYNAATGGTLLATVLPGVPFTPSPTVTTTYYVAAARVGCPEESLRVPVVVTVNTVGTPTTLNAAQQFCAFNSPTLASLQVNETNIAFFAAPTGGTALPLTTALANGTTYYVGLIDTITGCQSAVRLAITVALANLCDVTLNLKVMLQGALLNSSGGLMRDNLRTQSLIPLAQPYSSAVSTRFTHVNGGGSETTTNAVLTANAGTGNAIVDWIFIEIRDQANSATVIKTISALLQRDGDVVAANGGPLVVTALPQTFYVAVKHRNHFGTMGRNVLTATSGQATLDFTTLTDANIYVLPGTTSQVSMITVGAVKALYCGNANFDIRVKYDGAANDRQVAAGQVLSHVNNVGHVLNFSSATGYLSGDINMDGKVLYDGANNDRQIILGIVIAYPLNTSGLNNFNGMLEQIP